MARALYYWHCFDESGREEKEKKVGPQSSSSINLVETRLLSERKEGRKGKKRKNLAATKFGGASIGKKRKGRRKREEEANHESSNSFQGL